MSECRLGKGEVQENKRQVLGVGGFVRVRVDQEKTPLRAQSMVLALARFEAVKKGARQRQ
jgi:hypothetical protein